MMYLSTHSYSKWAGIAGICAGLTWICLQSALRPELAHTETAALAPMATSCLGRVHSAAPSLPLESSQTEKGSWWHADCGLPLPNWAYGDPLWETKKTICIFLFLKHPILLQCICSKTHLFPSSDRHFLELPVAVHGICADGESWRQKYMSDYYYSLTPGLHSLTVANRFTSNASKPALQGKGFENGVTFLCLQHG